MATIIIIVLLVILVGYIIYIFNKMIRVSNLNLEAFSNVDVALKKRYDLIPNLEEAVKGYAGHEKYTLERLTNMRTNLSEKMTIADRERQENKYSVVIRDVIACAENYPELKAAENFGKLQDSLVKIEEEIELARRYYNGTTRNYNSFIQKFPNNILASILGYNARQFFEVDLMSKKNIDIDFEDRRKTSRQGVKDEEEN